MKRFRTIDEPAGKKQALPPSPPVTRTRRLRRKSRRSNSLECICQSRRVRWHIVATSVSDIYNYRQAAPNLATSGQPSEEQLRTIANEGYAVIVNLALHDDPRYSLTDEAASVQALGLEYIHIPVQFGTPNERDLLKFFEVMELHESRRVWVHCAANKRVTAFLGLYWRLRKGWPEGRAFALLREIWQPDAVWGKFIAAQMAKTNAAQPGS